MIPNRRKIQRLASYPIGIAPRARFTPPSEGVAFLPRPGRPLPLRPYGTGPNIMPILGFRFAHPRLHSNAATRLPMSEPRRGKGA